MLPPGRLLASIGPAALAAVVVWNLNPASTTAGPAQPGARTIVFRNVTLYTATGEKPIPDGILVIKDGKIEAVGGKADVGPTPNDAEQVDLAGAVVIPGLVDTHSHIGVWSRPGVAANSDLSETSG